MEEIKLTQVNIIAKDEMLGGTEGGNRWEQVNKRGLEITLLLEYDAGPTSPELMDMSQKVIDILSRVK